MNSIGNWNCIFTPTFKQAMANERGGLAHLDRQEVIKTINHFSNVLDRSVFTVSSQRKSEHLKRLTFIEGGLGKNGTIGEKRLHAHVLIHMPDFIEFNEFENRVAKAVSRTQWMQRIYDIRPIEIGTERKMLSYTLKEGFDALEPAASRIIES